MPADEPKASRSEKIERIVGMLTKGKNPLLDKLDPQNLSKIIEQAAEESKREDQRKVLRRCG